MILLDLESGETWRVEPGATAVKGVGTMPPHWDELPAGTPFQVGKHKVTALPATTADQVATIRRKAQIILPKDASRILWELSPRPTDRILESGIGSGAMTIPLLAAVPQGKVVAVELRSDFGEWARNNVPSDMVERLEIHLGDLTKGLPPTVSGPFDAVLLDQPEPWLALPFLAAHLSAGARVCCYCPQVGQMEAAARTMTGLGFHGVRALELIERAWEIKERGARPSFDGLGHTGFLIFGRWPGSG